MRVVDWSELKGLVLAGGKGSRLRPFTYTGAKQLVPVANKPVLFYALEQLVAAGVHRIGLIVGDMASQVQEAVGDGTRFGAEVTYLHQPQPLGLAHAVAVARAWLGANPFVMVLGDNFLRGGIRHLVHRFTRERPDAQVHLVRVARPESLGVAVVDEGGRLVRVVEKPQTFVSDLAVIGVYCFTPAVHEVVASLRPSARGELEITDAIQGLVDRGLRVDALPVEDYWVDTGKMGDILDANRVVLETLEPRVEGFVDERSRLSGRVVVEAGARIVASTIEGPAIIGRDTLVERSYIGPFTSVYHSCRITDAELAGSVVLERTEIAGVPGRIEGSLIGRDVRLRGADGRPRAYRLVLGDHSEAQLPQ
ncbi:MAG: glucose-1-phosphate thymidylyltransferase [Chloroflexota bacterium]